MNRTETVKRLRELGYGDDLRGASLYEADLPGADLRGADLRGADLCKAYLRGASLYEADLRGTDLHEADLCEADLRGIKTDYSTRGVHPAPQGTLVVWMKKSGRIIKGQVNANVPRSCATTRKYRSAEVLVLEIEGPETRIEHASNHGPITIYEEGHISAADTWDPDRWNECSGGIHWFLSRAEALAWDG